MYGIKLFGKNKVSSFLVAVQLSVILALSMMVMLTVQYRQKMYAPIETLLNDLSGDGYYVDLSGVDTPSETNIKAEFEFISDIYCFKYDIAESDSDYYDIISCPDGLIDKLSIDLDEGSISDFLENTSNYCLVTDHSKEVGDTLTITIGDDTVSFIVAGIISDCQSLCGIRGEHYVEYDYRDFYIGYDSNVWERDIVIAADSYIKQAGISLACGYGFVSVNSDNLSKTEIKNEMMDNGVIVYCSTEEFTKKQCGIYKSAVI